MERKGQACSLLVCIKMMNETELAWAAGFIDGEGSITIAPRHKGQAAGFLLQLTVANTVKEPIDRVKKRQAAIADVFPIGNGSKRHPLAVILQEECYRAIRQANALGVAQ